MRIETRKQVDSYTAQIARINNVADPSKKFTVEPSVQQKLESRVQESSDFLKSVNFVPVTELKGEKVGMSVNSTLAARTDTNKNDRVPAEVGDLDPLGYECFFTEYDTAIRYSTLDAWAKFKDFQTRLRNMILRQQALDRLMIGFNGRVAAKETDRKINPLLEDVNVGWLQKYRNEAKQRVLSEVSAGTNLITIGKGGDYANVDALVVDAVNHLIEPWHQERTDLVAIMGRKMLADKYFPLINSDHAPTETLALDMLVSQKRIGGLQAVRAPFVPHGTIFITPLNNLSIYYQEGSRRRHIDENAKRSRIENYESSNDGYVIEDYEAGCLIENILISSPDE